MAIFNIEFTNPLPQGIQVGHIAWYLDASEGVEVQMGPIVAIGVNPIQIVVDAPDGVSPPDSTDFIFYAINPIGEVGSLKGYFAEAQFTNDSLEYAELFSTASEVFESSK
jgi:hypothetical protein